MEINGKLPAQVFEKGKVTVVLGAQWGDEGKGKTVDYLASKADLVCRYQGGHNAVHSVVVDGKEFVFSLVPSGILHQKCVSILGNGTAVNLHIFVKELKQHEKAGLTNWKGRLLISNRADIAFNFYKDLDKLQEALRGNNSFGTTRRGIGPAYASKAARDGIRIHDLIGNFDEFAEKFRCLVKFYKHQYPSLEVDVEETIEIYKDIREKIKPMVVDSVHYINRTLDLGKNVLVEGAQSTLLDIDLGIYPYVTSSNCSVAGVSSGLGVSPSRIGNVVGVSKVYLTRLGKGTFPTEITDDLCEFLRQRGGEYTQIGRKELRVGWLDIFMLQYSSMVNGLTALALMKLDIFDVLDEIKIGVAYYVDGKKLDTFPACDDEIKKVKVEYLTMPGWKSDTRQARCFEDLPENAKQYVRKIENLVGISVWWIGVGADRKAVINVC